MKKVTSIYIEEAIIDYYNEKDLNLSKEVNEYLKGRIKI